MNKVNFVTGRSGWKYKARRSAQALLAKTLPSEFMAKLYFFILMRKRLSLASPKTFNEKIQWYKLNYCVKNSLAVLCSDKYKVRDFVAEKGYGHTLTKLLGVWDNPEDIEWDVLPREFVVKCNHGCAYNLICTDKSELDLKWAKELLRQWLSEDFGLFNIEPHYDSIGKKIICEEYLKTIDAKLPVDYKIYCFDGEPKIVLVCTGRDSNVRLSFFDTSWNAIDIGSVPGDPNLAKPKLLSEALRMSRDLSEDFPFVRVDLYDCNDRIIFGELSFTLAAGLARYYSSEGDLYLGGLFNLPTGEGK